MRSQDETFGLQKQFTECFHERLLNTQTDFQVHVYVYVDVVDSCCSGFCSAALVPNTSALGFRREKFTSKRTVRTPHTIPQPVSIITMSVGVR